MTFSSSNNNNMISVMYVGGSVCLIDNRISRYIGCYIEQTFLVGIISYC